MLWRLPKQDRIRNLGLEAPKNRVKTVTISFRSIREGGPEARDAMRNGIRPGRGFKKKSFQSPATHLLYIVIFDRGPFLMKLACRLPHRQKE